MQPLVRLYIRSIVLGFALAALFTALLIWLDVAHLRHLILSSLIGWLAVAMLVIFNGIVFSGVQFAFVIMRMADSPPPRGGRRQRMPRMGAPALAIRVPATRSRDR
ncbi:hypothetical protein SAMN04489859_103217 [Paracoccus alcaliphilus]|uniref:Uncharacterized protein n=1 Tax=Paracoccus alcaliphilus TaxID=34002 RepID=A0A1H8LMI5_9RHOB|nr:hypothetical protein [Paracoccus alcaliphilus]WCR18013.1 hypothetical protein JHW40_17245 [Paracoccus alcaliphilus]SEO06335.1 hypothetical protein SAMN04489859_103217 [Paracoccus alcaliphilus]